MNKIFKDVINGFLKSQEVARELNKEYEQKLQNEQENKIEYTCCNVEVSGILEDIRICPECKEHF